jgi:hypothetical protein
MHNRQIKRQSRKKFDPKKRFEKANDLRLSKRPARNRIIGTDEISNEDFEKKVYNYFKRRLIR